MLNANYWRFTIRSIECKSFDFNTDFKNSAEIIIQQKLMQNLQMLLNIKLRFKY